MAVLKYEEIAEFLRARIAAGEIAPGDTIPSGRDLAEQWDVSRATAIKAVDVLRNDGVVVAKQGTGFVVTETPVARPAGARRAGSARILGGMPFLRVGTPDWAEPPPTSPLPSASPSGLRRFGAFASSSSRTGPRIAALRRGSPGYCGGGTTPCRHQPDRRRHNALRPASDRARPGRRRGRHNRAPCLGDGGRPLGGAAGGTGGRASAHGV